MKTELVCRLCAAPKEPDEIRCAIDDRQKNIERKLIDCCDWYLHRRDVDLPKSVCNTCYLLLQQSWNFRQTVSRAQYKLSFRRVSGGEEVKRNAGDLADVKIECDGVVDTADTTGDDSNVNETAEFSTKDTESDSDDGVGNEPSLLGPWYNDSSFEDGDNDAADHSDSQDFSDCDHAEVMMEAANFGENNDSAHNASVPSEEPATNVADQSESRLISSTASTPSSADISQMTDGDSEEDGNIIADQADELNSTTWKTITTKCSLCDNFAGDHVKLQMHYDDVHPNTRLELNCPFCDKTEQLTGQLYRHHIVKEHFPHLASSCYHCHALFTNTQQLSGHLRLHPKDPTHNVCPHCHKYFTQSPTNLFIHMITHMPENERPVFECYLCKNKFTLQRNLQRHMELHIGVRKTSICHKFGKASRTPSDLKKHMGSHSTRRPFICELCPKRFKTNVSLSLHHRAIHDRRQYDCDKCDYRAPCPKTLRSHMLHLHQDSLKFPCKDCDKRFHSMRALKLHQESHSNSSLYRCELCGMATKTKIGMQRHHKQVHLKG